MLIDPLVLGIVTTANIADDINSANVIADTIELHTNDFSPGSTRRIGTLDDGTKVTVSIAHSQSNENAPFATVRTQVRIDLIRINSVTGKPVKMSTYVINSRPESADFSEADAATWVRSLGLFLLAGKLTEGTLGTSDDSIPRILAGEP